MSFALFVPCDIRGAVSFEVLATQNEAEKCFAVAVGLIHVRLPQAHFITDQASAASAKTAAVRVILVVQAVD